MGKENTKNKSFYLTTTLPYVNADLHIGHALEFIRADVVARYKNKSGFDVFFNTGTDEHGMKIFEKAKAEGKEVHIFVDEMFERFKKQVQSFGLADFLHYIRTTDKYHEKSAQEFWKRVRDNGYIYKKNYKSKYCVNCEEEKTDSQLINGACPDHPNSKLEIIDEENYFFAFSKFQKPLLEFYAKNPNFVVPNFRYNEAKAFVERGLTDFSISRLKDKMPWGVPVPDDNNHVMYVWFDALSNYISTLGWGSKDDSNYDKYWINGTPTQYCGKDNNRFQTIMWQAMLMAAGLPNSYQVVINGHITAEGGVKMSKSLGNVINPLEIAKEYGTDALRFFLLKEVSNFDDSPFSLKRFKEVYNADLANGLGNLLSRVMKMAVQYGANFNLDGKSDEELSGEIENRISKYDLQSAMEIIWREISKCNEYIQKEEPFKKFKVNPDGARKDLEYLISRIEKIAIELSSFLPETSEKISNCLKSQSMPESPLFLRKE